MAQSYKCKYFEISCVLSYNVENLLQGIGAQILLKEKLLEKMKAKGKCACILFLSLSSLLSRTSANVFCECLSSRTPPQTQT